MRSFLGNGVDNRRPNRYALALALDINGGRNPMINSSRYVSLSNSSEAPHHPSQAVPESSSIASTSASRPTNPLQAHNYDGWLGEYVEPILGGVPSMHLQSGANSFSLTRESERSDTVLPQAAPIYDISSVRQEEEDQFLHMVRMFFFSAPASFQHFSQAYTLEC